jgi:L-threonylcarbamoyladenylate synthase
VGVESTILGCLGGPVTLLRPGGVTRAMVEAVIGEAIDEAGDGDGDRPLAPGRLASHYATNAHVRLDATEPGPGEAWLGFGRDGRPTGPLSLNLSRTGELTEAAANLFAHLRALDAVHPTGIAVAPIPAEGLGEAIRDRLIRASAPRPSRA